MKALQLAKSRPSPVPRLASLDPAVAAVIRALIDAQEKATAKKLAAASAAGDMTNAA